MKKFYFLRKLPYIIIYIGILLCVIGLFLPLVSATPEYRTYLTEISDQVLIDNMEPEIFKDISLIDYYKIYNNLINDGKDFISSQGLIILYITGYVILIIILLIATIKIHRTLLIYISTTVFLLTMLIFSDFKHSGIIDNVYYNCGTFIYLLSIGSIIIIITNIIWIIKEREIIKI